MNQDGRQGKGGGGGRKKRRHGVKWVRRRETNLNIEM